MSFSSLGLALQVLIALFGAFFLAFWVSLIVWTFRDVRARSRDIFAQLLAVLMVVIFNVFGLVLYFLLRPQETLAENYERALEEEALLQDIEERHTCPGCKQKIRAEFQFCPSCHTRLKQPCPACAKLLYPQWSICPYCGTASAPNTLSSNHAGASSSVHAMTTRAVPTHVRKSDEGDTAPLTKIARAKVAASLHDHEAESEEGNAEHVSGADRLSGTGFEVDDTAPDSDSRQTIT